MDKLNILVLGVGGNVSQGILKALSLSKLPHRVVGACISPLALGLYTVDRAYISPPVYDPNFMDWILNICQKEYIQAILSGVEPVLTILSRNAEKIYQETGTISIVSKPTILSITNDKLATCQWLEKQGFNYPRYAPSWDFIALKKLVKDCGYPLIAKLCSGKGSHGVIEIHDSNDLEYVSGRTGYVVQELLGDSNTEYTVGCFCDRQGTVRGTIAMHRELLQGTTYRADVGDFPEVRAEASKIATAFRPMGPCNIQLRISDGKPVCFEINMRFSGTTPMRARLGFNEVEATLRHYVLGEHIENLPSITQGIILRYWNEMYVDHKAFTTLSENGKLKNTQQYDLLVEDYGVRR